MKKRVSARSEKTATQITAEGLERALARPMVVRCAVEGCRWYWRGSAAEAMENARSHRRLAHPELPERSKVRRTQGRPNPALITKQQMGEDEAAEVREEIRRRAFLHGIELDGEAA